MTPETLAVRRYLSARRLGIPWGALVREIGGLANLETVLADDGRPDPERIEQAICAVHWRRIGKGRHGVNVTPEERGTMAG